MVAEVKVNEALSGRIKAGQFATVLRDQFLIDVIRCNQVNGQPFKVGELSARIHELAG